MERNPRFAVDSKTYKALKVWSALEGISLSALVGKLTFNHLPDNVRMALGEYTLQPSGPQRVLGQEPQKTETTAAKRKLTKTDLEYIKENYTAGVPLTEIGRGIGRRESTVRSAIDRMIASGALTKREP